jgi:quaternary ammonium compound-resistance protein SugE
MSWYTLLAAGLFEIAWAIGLGYSDGVSKPVPTVATGIALVISMVLLARAVEDLPIGTAYAVWTGIGAVGTASLGIVLFDEPATLLRLGFVGLIVVGIVGLNLVSGGHWSSTSAAKDPPHRRSASSSRRSSISMSFIASSTSRW